MDLALLLKTIVIGIVEGLTEFLPISSTGHIILAEELLHFEGPQGKVFEIVIQLGAILAICLLYYAKIIATVGGVLRREPVALRFAIEAINRGANIPQREGEILECDLFGLAASTEDMHEGMRAFIEKRKPSFKGK